jgi:hypothetical protein
MAVASFVVVRLLATVVVVDLSVDTADGVDHSATDAEAESGAVAGVAEADAAEPAAQLAVSLAVPAGFERPDRAQAEVTERDQQAGEKQGASE